jgi:hypothetical protein
LFDDPLFNPGVAEYVIEHSKQFPNPRISLRRWAMLRALNQLGEALEARDRWREHAAKAAWVFEKLTEHIPEEVVSQILMDADVIGYVDPEFTFYNWLLNRPDPPSLEQP